jgi:hypothetical protein
MSGSTSSQLFPPDTDVPVEIVPRGMSEALKATLEGVSTNAAAESPAVSHVRQVMK